VSGELSDCCASCALVIMALGGLERRRVGARAAEAGASAAVHPLDTSHAHTPTETLF
jgi:hypothetical protein